MPHFWILAFLCSYCQAVDQVLLMRHCVRSQFPDLRGRGDPQYDYPSNYSAKPLPSLSIWNTSAFAQCTPRGLELAEVLGTSLSGVLSQPRSVVADNVSRCIDTASRVASGLGADTRNDGVTKALDPVKFRVCKPATADELATGVNEMLARAENESSFLHTTWSKREELLEDLQKLVGHGVAPSIASIPASISEGVYVGGMHVAAEAFIENFVLEAGAGLSVAWGQLDGAKRSDLYDKWMPLDILYNHISHSGRPLAARNGAVLWDILRQLDDGQHGSRVVVGHDTNIDAVAKLLDLAWQCGPYPPNAVPPMVGLLFSKVEDGVTISAVCPALEGDDAGKAVLSSVKRQGSDISLGSIPLEVLQQETLQNLGGLDCVAPLPTILEQPTIYT